jgi:hypothetical protein
MQYRRLSAADKQDSDCTKFEKTYEQLCYKYENSDTLVIARCDAAQSRPAANVSHFPTTKLYPAKEKDLPIEYNCSDLTYVDGYIKFIQDEATKAQNLATNESDSSAGN